MNKRIAMISMHTCPLAYEEGKETGGMNIYVMSLAQELVKQGYTIDIYTRLQSLKHKKIVSVTKQLRIIHIAAGPRHIAKKKLIHFVDEFAKNVALFIQENKLSYDLFHAHYYLSGLAALKLQQSYDTPLPLVINFHTLAIMKNLVARSELEQEDEHRVKAEIMLSRKADLLIAPSVADKEYLQYLYGAPEEKIAVINPGVDTDIFYPLPQKIAREHIKADINHKIILFVGRIEPLKGIDTLLYSLKILLEKEHSNICLFIVGGDISQKEKQWSQELQKLNELRQLLGITTEVNFVGQKSQHELAYYYNAADVVVMPSHYESFGMAALEAIACGTHVITTNVAGIATLIDKPHQKFITTANNPLLLAEQINKLLAHTDNHGAMQQQLTQGIKNFTWENVAKKVAAAYERLMLNCHCEEPQRPQSRLTRRGNLPK